MVRSSACGKRLIGRLFTREDAGQVAYLEVKTAPIRRPALDHWRKDLLTYTLVIAVPETGQGVFRETQTLRRGLEVLPLNLTAIDHREHHRVHNDGAPLFRQV